ncbi:hypothetical protein AWT69_002333 [Pseudomonas putida]|nr:hypothetical protein AWT69_002333 [Pseudomonas putida]
MHGSNEPCSEKDGVESVNDKHWHRFSKGALPVLYLRLTLAKG